MSQKIIGQEIYQLAKSLWLLNRSLTGNGVRETLNIIKHLLPDLKIHNSCLMTIPLKSLLIQTMLLILNYLNAHKFLANYHF